MSANPEFLHSAEALPLAAQVHTQLQLMRAGIDDLRASHLKMEASMQRMAEAVTRLAVVEERQDASLASLAKLDATIDDLSRRLRAVETQGPSNARVEQWLNYALIAIAGAAMAYVAKSTGLI
ncbi:MAG TPA: hypothetical protein DCM32_08085 [Xanthomonadaceae bacterium]|nr:hypothetical protein [Xanthomonadaceae bacterium]